MRLAQTIAAAALVSMAAQGTSAQVASAGENLPAGYMRAECIQGDGKTCDVETDFIPNPQTDRFVFDVEFTEVSHKMFVFCARKGSGDASWSLNVQEGYKLRFDYSTQEIPDAAAYVPCVRYACEVGANVLSYASGEDSRTLTATADPSFTKAGGALHLFRAPGNSTSVGDFKLYSFKIYRNNALIHDLVPALDGSAFPVLVDVVGNLSVKMSGGFSAQMPGTDGNEALLKAAIMNLFNQANPVVAGERKYISLAYITDTHKCKRVEGDTDPTNPVTNYWYHGELVDPEPSIRLLGKVAEEAAFDGLIHAGDFSTAVPPVPFDEGDYLNEIRNVKTLVSTHLPDTPFFAVDGNHDRNYWNEDHTSGHSMSDAEWAAALAEINTDVSSNPEIVRTAGTGNSYTLDFKRCLANGGKNIRLVMVSGYDANGGSDPHARMSEGLVFGDSSLTPLNTVVGVTAHDYRDGFRTAARTYLIRNEGAGFFGAITGHRHEAATEPIKDTDADLVAVKNAFSSFGDTSLSAYHFAIFIFDTDLGKMREIRLAGDGDNTPVLIDHSISVGMGFEGIPDRELVAIQGDGKSYFETDFVLNPQTDKIVTELELTDIPESQFAFAARANSTDSKTAYSLNLRSNGYRFDYKGSGTPTGTLESGVKYIFTAENNVLTWSGGEGTVAVKDEKFTEAGGPLRLFSAAGNDAFGTFRLYSFQIYRSDVLIHDFSPYYTDGTGATLIDKVKEGVPIKLVKKGSGAFIPVEDPKPPRKAKRLEWIQGDGIDSYFETAFVPDPSRDKMEIVVTLTDLSKNQFLFGARADGESGGAWALQLRGKTQIRYDYNTPGTAQGRALEKGVKYVFTAETNTLSWSHGDGIQSSEPLFTPASGPLFILFTAGGSGTCSPCKLHSFRVWRDGKLIHEFLPTRLPSGVLNLMDYGPNPIPVTRRGFFKAGPAIPPKQGLVLAIY